MSSARKTKKIQINERIISKGQKASDAYLITRGLVQVYLEKNGRIINLAELGPGSIFGESALFGEGNAYGANVKALEETELTVITRESYQKEVDASGPMIRAIIHMLIERQRKTNEALVKSETREWMDVAFV